MLKIEERKDEMPNDSDFKWLLQLHVMAIYKQINSIEQDMLQIAFEISFTATPTTTTNDDANKIVIELSNALIYGYLA